MTTEYMQEIGRIKLALISGTISYEEAKREAAPFIAAMNEKMAEISKQYGARHRPVSFSKLMRQ